MPRLPTPITPVDYLRWTQMITRIRTLEHVATERFFKGNSDYRDDITKVIKERMFDAQNKLPKLNRDNLRPVGPPVIDPLAASRPDASPDSTGHGCTYPYCPSGGVCELCGVEEAHNQLLAAAEDL